MWATVRLVTLVLLTVTVISCSSFSLLSNFWKGMIALHALLSGLAYLCVIAVEATKRWICLFVLTVALVGFVVL